MVSPEEHIIQIDDSIQSLGLLYQEINHVHAKIVIDLSGIGFLSPVHTMTLVVAIMSYKNLGSEVFVRLAKNEKVSNYINDIGIQEFCRTNFRQPRTISYINSQTAMPIRRIDKEHMTEYIVSTQAYIQQFCEERDLSMLDVCIAELLNNVYDHAQSPIDAYVFCQYFPKLNIISLVVADYGLGIPGTVNNYLKAKGYKVLLESEAIQWAIKENTSIASHPNNKGKGLNTLISFMKTNKGEARLLSNGTRLEITPDAENTSSNPIGSFKGTLVELTIRIDNLEKKEVDGFVDIW